MSTAPAFDPRQLAFDIVEPYHYHGAYDAAWLALLARQESGAMRQQTFRVADLAKVLQAAPRDRDCYISQAEFIARNRRAVNLLCLPLLFVDLDPPKGAGYDIGPDAWRHRVLMFCQDEGLPLPSLIVYSGRGAHLKWILSEPLPRAALPRWNLAQRLLGERLASLGADPNARDASRVLRLEQTVNTKTGRRCEVIWTTDGGDGLPLRYSFDALFDDLAPLAREELAALREERQRSDPGAKGKPTRWKDRPALELVKGGRYGLKRIDYAELAFHRLEDLRTLAAIRTAERGDLEGERMNFLFWSLNFLALSNAVSPSNFWNEAQALAAGLAPGWTFDRGQLGTLYRKTAAYVRGETVEWEGRQVPGLYTPRNATLIERFTITPEEQRRLRTIVSKDEARHRHAKREEARRRAAGAVDRATYEATAQHRRDVARALRADGLKQREIAERLGVSESAVRHYLKG